MAKEPEKQWEGKSRGGRWGYTFFISTIRLLGIRCAYFFLALVVLYFIPFAPKATKSVWLYHRRRRKLGVLRSLRELYCHYYVFGQTLIDKVAMNAGMTNRYNYVFDNYERFLDLLNSGQGVVMIGAHVGCWEAGAGFFGEYGKKINIAMFDVEHQQIKELLESNSSSKNNYKIIAINQDAISAVLQMKIALNNGEYLCFNVDRYVDKNNTRAVEFMDAKANFPIGPFRIAAKCGAPVVFYYAMREPARTYRFIFEEAGIEGKNSEQNITDQYVKSLERILKSYPRQWFNFYDFWNESIIV